LSVENEKFEKKSESPEKQLPAPLLTATPFLMTICQLKKEGRSPGSAVNHFPGINIKKKTTLYFLQNEVRFVEHRFNIDKYFFFF